MIILKFAGLFKATYLGRIKHPLLIMSNVFMLKIYLADLFRIRLCSVLFKSYLFFLRTIFIVKNLKWFSNT